MKRWSIGRPILTNVVLSVALITIFGAGSAAAALAIRSADIVNGEVKTADLANGAVTKDKIAANAVTGAKVDESTLGLVPNADMLDGKDSTSFMAGPGRTISSSSPFSWGDSVYVFFSQVAYDIGFNIAARCSNDQIYFTNFGSAPLDYWYRHNGGDTTYGHLQTDSTYTATEVDGPHLVTIHIVQTSTGKQASLEYSVNERAPSGAGDFGDCFTYAEAVLNY